MLEEIGRLGEKGLYRIVFDMTCFETSLDFIDKREAGVLSYCFSVYPAKALLEEMQRFVPDVYQRICKKDGKLIASYKVERVVCQMFSCGKATKEEREDKYKESRRLLDSKWILRRDDEMQSGYNVLREKIIAQLIEYNRSVVLSYCCSIKNTITNLQLELCNRIGNDNADIEKSIQVFVDVEDLKKDLDKKVNQILR